MINDYRPPVSKALKLVCTPHAIADLFGFCLSRRVIDIDKGIM